MRLVLLALLLGGCVRTLTVSCTTDPLTGIRTCVQSSESTLP